MICAKVYYDLKLAVYNDGNSLKAVGQGIGNGQGTNTSGFSGLLAGMRNDGGVFGDMNTGILFWSSSRYDASTSYEFTLNYLDSIIYTDAHHYISYGFSIRCIKDETSIVQSCPGIPTVTYESKTYNTVQIGEQCWLKENLDVGVMIDSTQDQTNNSIIEKYCYNDNPNNCDSYGGLYQWNETMQYVTNEGSRGICPDGWHIPTLADYQILKTTVNQDGNSLKAIGQGTGSGAGTNISGFSALLAGVWENSVFQLFGTSIYAWSSTQASLFGIYSADYLRLDYNSGDLFLYEDFYYYVNTLGFSVRCLKN